MKKIKYKEIKVGEYVTVSELGSGWAALQIAILETNDATRYEDVWRTGMGRYATREEALEEAKSWAEFEELELRV